MRCLSVMKGGVLNTSTACAPPRTIVEKAPASSPAVRTPIGWSCTPSSLPASAQSAGKVYRVGILGDKAADPNENLVWQILREGLREHGWLEGVNIRIEGRWIEGNVARLPELAAHLVRQKPDVIVTRGSFFTGGLKAATSSIPIVFLAHADPVATGHVASLARPGGNITGMALLQTELGPKGLEVLHSAVPAATRIAVLWHSGTPSTIPGLKALEEPGERPAQHHEGEHEAEPNHR